MVRITPLLVPVLLVLSACGSRNEPVPQESMGSPGPALAVERFLQAANANDLGTMMELFGTANRSIAQIDGQSRAERRMHVLATLLRHDDFAILSQQGVPGRLQEATELQVEIRRGERAVVVPHLVVRRRGGGWVIERIDIEKLTQST